MNDNKWSGKGIAWFVTAWLGMTLLPGLAQAQTVKETVTYKKVDGIEIKADVFCDSATTPRPAVVWIHGGALINGHRESIPAQVREFATNNGYVLVSIDYRLAPESKLPAIIADIEDAFRWMRGEGATRFGIDPNRIAVTGGSAGGFLTLATGFRVQPAPRVLLAFWGYGEILTDWATKPSPHARHNQKRVGAGEVTKQLSRSIVSDSRERKSDGGMIYNYGRQSGEWAKLIAGSDPLREPEKIIPFLPLKNVTAKYPPTVLIHGSADTDVPFEQSQLMAREFAKHGVPYQLHEITNAEHGLVDGNPEQIKEAYQKAFEFVKQHLEQP
jgi:acetyl esterase/lipase